MTFAEYYEKMAGYPLNKEAKERFNKMYEDFKNRNYEAYISRKSGKTQTEWRQLLAMVMYMYYEEAVNEPAI